MKLVQKQKLSLHNSTKAETLHILSNCGLLSAKILPVLFFTVSQWRRAKKKCLRQVAECFNQQAVIVRSSSLNEDSSTASLAGAYLSLKNVETSELELAIEQVIASYHDDLDGNQILIQPMLRNVIRSGVAFSHDPKTSSPYRIINWVDNGDTSHITGGKSGRTWQGLDVPRARPPSMLRDVCALLAELLDLVDGIPIDLEFAHTQESEEKATLWLLQVRPLIIASELVGSDELIERLQRISDTVRTGMSAHPFLKGKTTVYGIMPDWNPAEIIGVRPKPFALSLYRELITDSIWAYQRHNYGYRNLRSFPLMTDFCGLPYIDVRVSFNSFVPADLQDNLAQKLVDHYINELLKEPRLHDKVEFEIVYSCYSFDLEDRLKKLIAYGFSESECTELAISLRSLTNRIIDPLEGLWKKDAEKLEKLAQRRKIILESNLDTTERIYWLLEDVKRYGTLPFAGLARAGFIAIQILKSLVSVGVLTPDDSERFMRSLKTVSGQLATDRYCLSKHDFLAKYGHLRPGTYDILSPRYDEKPDEYFDWSREIVKNEALEPFSLTLAQMKEISVLMSTHQLNHDVVGLFEFLQSAIELREWAKFEFTRSISDALSLMKDYGCTLGVSKEDMAYCDVASFYKIHGSTVDPGSIVKETVYRGKLRYHETMTTTLPPLITSPRDVWAFEWPDSSPNFITRKTVLAPVSGIDHPQDIDGKIVFITNADPGFDWLFTYRIAGLVTAWGGVNSHMAIRAGELGIPAVIGAGEQLFQLWSRVKKICLYCSEGRVEIIA
ncbi:MAG: PEP-utilizing enzyme [Pseudomonadales bacterium]|uniref:Phosphoenolpyruvate synthase/pyruvate phosphate dikinase n=1 Tax=Oleiphilus messinensis TaxID=141451 RepID=A0A1Y0IA97_9GAMM|nr:PEP-utilizing enzyme [Oleiphilus messinensis]ARU57170.1 phosphoenolpyruvate synthase/pyruvate phosphate dikinase [Oleiphilus messinensis]MCG8613682.1 PEP-utilizing enzyme [Pseudomonadales bacterium]